jgi:hypothetical protein
MPKNKLLFNKNGPQSQLNKTQQSSQYATVTTDHQESTARLLIALVLTDHSMDQQVLHAPELSQPLSHTTTPTPLLVDHMPPQVILLTPTHLHQSQPRLSFNSLRSQLLLPPSHHQRRSQSSTQRSPRLTLLSTDKSEL